MSFEIRNGKIQARECLLNAVHHRNLSCRACSHLSPRAKKFFVDPDKVLNDLSILAKYYHPKHVSLMGGEPLLHPDLFGVVEAIRKSGISERIRIVTNGILLGQMPDLLWQSVDQVHISLYPGYRISVEELQVFQQRAREHGVDLELRYVDRFRESYTELGTTDARLVHRIYSTCQSAHICHCHTVCDGHFYRCSQSVFSPRLLQGSSEPSAVCDGLKLAHSETFGDDLLNFLLVEKPLESCRYCLGTVGRRFPHMQESRRVSRTPHSTEELVDWEYLEKLEKADNLFAPPCWLHVANTLAKRALASMPPAVQLLPVVSRVIATVHNVHPALRNIHPALQ